MKLIRLHLQGFKSFKDRTTINFDEGITGIVGPNGCGKSNIVDALFWVMGEQSAKHLRGNKMKDLIFAGSSKYSPAGFAEVTLVLLNDAGKHIHIGGQVVKPAEIALTRKLYKNGETEYRINNMPARLKDIHEVFMDTGAGAKSYSIIAQGEINRLVQAKPEERRTMIEEVAGITKFKIRKKESLKKIEHTESNLNRLSDLQGEIYKNLKQLEKQAEKAQKARRLKERVEHHQLITDSHTEMEFLSDFVDATKTLEQNEHNFNAFSLEKNNLEVTLEDERIKKSDLMERIDDFQSEFNDMSKELAKDEERLKHLTRALSQKEDNIVEKRAQNDELEADIEDREQKQEELSLKLEDIKSANFEDIDFTDKDEKVETLKEELLNKEEELSDLSITLDEKKGELSTTDQTISSNSLKLQEYSSILEGVMSEIEDIEKNTVDTSDKLIKEKEELVGFKGLLLDAKEEFSRIEKEKALKSEQFKQNDKELRELSKEVIKLDLKKQSLIDINNSGKGPKEGALEFLKKNTDKSFEILGNIIECDPKYARALEVFFDKDFDGLISQELEHIGSDSSLDELSFDYIYPKEYFSKSTVETKERLAIKGLKNVIAIEEILKINQSEFSSVLSTYFNGHYIVDSLEERDFDIATSAVNELNIKGIISLDGHKAVYKTINGIKLSKRTKESEAMGVVQRNNLINELTTQLSDKNLQLSELEIQASELKGELEQLSNDLEKTRQEKDSLTQKVTALDSALKAQERNFSSHEVRLATLNKRKHDTSKLKLEILENAEELEQKRDDLETQVSQMQERFLEFKDEIGELRNLHEIERGELLELKANAKTFHSQVEGLEEQIDDLKTQKEKYKLRFANNIDSINSLQEEIELASNEIEELKITNTEKAQELSERENVLNLIKDELTQLLSGMQDRESEVKKLTQKINEIEKLNVELELKVEKIIIDEEILVRNCFDRYRVNLRSVLGTYLELTGDQLSDLRDITSMFFMESEEGEVELETKEYTFEKRFPQSLKESKEKLKRYKSDLNRLGEINWQAVEDYDRQKLRFDFLKTQQEQLRKSLEDLQAAIAHIDEKSKERFAQAYHEVNDRFVKVFPIIFGGGEARLDLVGDLDSTECGIDIIAKPPGKKMQSINLMSGGEKAMTAVSLIFSIFLVKPSPFCLLDEVDAPLDDANVGRFNELLREMSSESQFILITHNKKTMELNDTLYGVTMQEPGVSKAVSVQLH